MIIDVSENPSASIFREEDGGSKFLPNVGKYLSDYKTS
jgi:hypothetical protein